MGKKIGESNSSTSLHPTPPQQHPSASLPHRPLHFSQKPLGFCNFLKEGERLRDKDGRIDARDEGRLEERGEEVLRFFNFEKTYTFNQLQDQFCCLASLLHLLGPRIRQSKFTNEFRYKIRRFLLHLVNPNQLSRPANAQVQAVLYILAFLVCRERVDRIRSIGEFNRKVLGDKAVVRAILSIELSGYKRTDKFYGVILTYIWSQQPSQHLKSLILKSIFGNLRKIEHEATLFNCLVYLRAQKNRTTIHYNDLLGGNTVQVLIRTYSRYIDRYESYYIMDYLVHLHTLFPTLVSQLLPAYLTLTLLPNLNLNLHPLHESSLLQFVHLIFKYSEPGKKQMYLNEVTAFMLKNRQLGVKLVPLVVQYGGNDKLMLELFEVGYFNDFLGLMRESEAGWVQKWAQMMRKIITRFKGINSNISLHLECLLSLRLQTVGSEGEGNHLL